MLVNLTPHAITIEKMDGSTITVEPNGACVRVSTRTLKAADRDGIQIYTSELGDVTGLPEPQDGTLYLVSRMVFDALEGHLTWNNRVACPNTGAATRDEKGYIVSVKGLIAHERA